MAKWKCNNCGYALEAPEPPQHCFGVAKHVLSWTTTVTPRTVG